VRTVRGKGRDPAAGLVRVLVGPGDRFPVEIRREHGWVSAGCYFTESGAEQYADRLRECIRYALSRARGRGKRRAK
jgi:hypothetical protein